jgi:outer membrane protein OmpA-like peptidoglycan-associated protein
VRVEAVAEGYFFESFMTKVFGSPELYKKYNKEPNLSLPPAKAGEKAVLRDLFFVGNQAVLLPVSEPELPKILRFMQVNPEIRVEIAGHINHPGVSPDNLENWEWELSVNRAKLVYTYLLDHGVSADRMRFRGYGNSEMLFPKPTNETQMEKNRRVEIRVY